MVVAHGAVLYRNVVAKFRPEVPHGRILKCDTLQTHAAATDEMEQFGADIVLVFLPPVIFRAHAQAGIFLLFGRHRVPAVFLGVHHSLARCPVPPLVSGGVAALERPPMLPRSVYYAASADFDVRRAVCTQWRLPVFAASVARLLVGSEEFAERFVKTQPRVEFDYGHVIQVKADMTLEDNGAGKPYAVRYGESTAALAFQMGNGLGESVGAECQPVALGSEVGYRYGECRYLRFFHRYAHRSRPVCPHVACHGVSHSHDDCRSYKGCKTDTFDVHFLISFVCYN